jgi:zinc finger SWIM domain-containing protein 3
MNNTNNRLENFNGKLKEVVDLNSTLENFLENLYVLLASMRNERDHKTIFKMQKVGIDFFEPNSAESDYKNILTTYAFEQVLTQFSLRSEVNLSFDNENHIVKSSEGMLIVTSDSCGCIFRKSMGLPCRHIFAVRQLLGWNLFDAKLCLERWTMRYYRQHQRVFNTFSETKESCVEICVAPRKKKILAQHEKFKLALRTTSLLATLVSESTGPSFEQRIDLLKELQKGWEHGKVMVLNELVQTDLRVSDTVSSQTFSDAGVPNDVDLIENSNKEDRNEIDFRNVSSEQYVTVDNLQQNQEECFVVLDKAGVLGIYKF